MNPQPKTLIKNLIFTEGPRWKDGRLFFSDFFKHEFCVTDINSCIKKGRIEFINVNVPGIETP
jgi:hypothetical protein